MTAETPRPIDPSYEPRGGDRDLTHRDADWSGLDIVVMGLGVSGYAAADALVHPAENDPHPLICSEAAAVGLPMILSDKVGTIGPTDVSRTEENTLAFPCGDVPALAAAVGRMASDRALVAAMGAASARIYGETDLSRPAPP